MPHVVTSRALFRWVTLGAVLLSLAYAILDTRPGPASDTPTAGGDAHIVALYQAERSGQVVEGTGAVLRVLRDDRDGSQHQRFILRLTSGHTLLVSHNIDLAPRVVDLEAGDRVEFRGQYEWNDRGGVLHWTHHDPDGRRAGGWLRHGGTTYR